MRQEGFDKAHGFRNHAKSGVEFMLRILLVEKPEHREVKGGRERRKVSYPSEPDEIPEPLLGTSSRLCLHGGFKGVLTRRQHGAVLLNNGIRFGQADWRVGIA